MTSTFSLSSALSRRPRLTISVVLVVTAVTLALGSPVSAARAAASATPAAATSDPIVFLHGWGSDGTGGRLTSLANKFKADGVPADRLFHFGYTTSQSNRTTAAELADFIRGTVLAQTGADRVDLVAHSMGSLSSRHCIKFVSGCAGMVDDWVSLGGPNHGTLLAVGCPLVYREDVACREMAPRSRFLRQLNAGDETPGRVSYTTVRSQADEQIWPRSSTSLDGADNHAVRGLGHDDLVSDAGVYRIVRSAVID